MSAPSTFPFEIRKLSRGRWAIFADGVRFFGETFTTETSARYWLRQRMAGEAAYERNLEARWA